MKQLMLRNIIVACIFIGAAGVSLADFDDTGAGARAIGLGGAYTALADDVFGIYYNPAGLGLLQTAEVAGDIGKLYAGLDDNSNLLSGFAGIAFPLLKSEPQRVVGSSTTVTTSYLKHYGTIAVAVKYFTLTDYYQESEYYLSYGLPLSKRLAVGASLKMLNESYVIDDYLRLSPVFNYGNKSSVQNISYDVGAIYNISPRFFAGASVQDVNQPNMGLLAVDNIPATANIGLGWKEKGMAWGVTAMNQQNLWYYSTGFERYLGEVFGLRGGVSIGGDQYFNIAAGFSINLYRVQLDYVFQYPISGIQDTSGTSRLSFVFRFGRRAKADTEMGSLEYYYAQMQEELEDTRQKLLAAEQDKKNMENMLIGEAAQRIQDRLKTAQDLQSGTTTTTHIAYAAKPWDSIESVALKYYGNSKLWTEIYPLNKDSIGLGGALIKNRVLILPVIQPIPSVSAAPSTSASDSLNQTTASPTSSDIDDQDETEPPAKKEEVQPKKSGPFRHIVQVNENLRTIAQKYYNDSSRWKDIYQANKDTIVNGQVSPGQELTIP
ncbi:MAG: LysM peptidoglycan-binding domain-containing protein [Endomicrobiales bacterium]